MKTLFKNFILCGILGWCFEIIYTAAHSLRRRDMKLTGQTSIWMFPIYGLAALLKPLFTFMKTKPVLIRGSIYSFLIFAAEFIAGDYLTKKNICPWDYFRSKWNVKRLIRLDYIPHWMAAGLIFEKILTSPLTQGSPKTSA